MPKDGARVNPDASGRRRPNQSSKELVLHLKLIPDSCYMGRKWKQKVFKIITVAISKYKTIQA